VLVGTVLESELAERRNHVLDGWVLAAAVLAAELVEPCDLVQEVVDNGDDDGDTDGVGPNDDNSDDIHPAVLALVEGGLGVSLVESAGQPTEQTEESSNDIDSKDGADKLEGRPCFTTTRNEDEPVLGKGNFEEEDFLHIAKVLDDTTVGQEHGATDDPSAKSENYTEHDGDDPDLWQLPFDRTLFRVCVIVGYRDGGKIGEEGDEDDELGTDGLADDDHRCDQVNLQMQAKGDTVLDVGLHALENLTGGLDGQDDSGKTGGKEDDISSSLGSFGRSLDGDTAIGYISCQQRSELVLEDYIPFFRDGASLTPSPVMAVK
jgi:hypothetical protein